MSNSERLNFVLILTDQQQRKSLGCYGNQHIKTPRLDALGREGIVFDSAFTANSICSPSRASLMTGRYPRTHGLIINGMQLDPVNEITLPQVLSANGYRTASVGKIHLASHNDVDSEMIANKSGYESPESKGYWAAGKRLSLPYYGFQEVRMCAGHSNDWTDYYHDLLAKDPNLPELLKMENALKPPSGAPSSWKSAIPEEYHSTTWVANEAIQKLERFAGEAEPFFLCASFPDPHFPYCPPSPWCDMYDPACVPMPRRHRDQLKTASAYYLSLVELFTNLLGYAPMDMPEDYIREIIAHTYGMVSLLDKHIGRIMDTISQSSLRDNTIVVFTTDHGEHLGDHGLIYKAAIYDELIHLPLIWWSPSRFGQPRRQQCIVSHIDLMPTILDLAGIAGPRGVQGISYKADLETGECPGRDWAYLEDDAEDGKAYMRTVWTPRCRLTYYLPAGEGDLFDLENDPDEFVNLWNDPASRGLRNEMMELLLRATIESSDPKPERFTSA
jgi:arylsulfatase A-like enzyme